MARAEAGPMRECGRCRVVLTNTPYAIQCLRLPSEHTQASTHLGPLTSHVA